MLKILQFEPFSSAVDASFWHLLSSQKIDVFKLDASSRPLQGYYEANGGSAHFCLGTSAFSTSNLPPRALYAPGTLVNTNTIEEFKDLDKTTLFQECADQIFKDIQTGEAVKNPHLLNRFLLITFADLKKYVFYHWFAFPALVLPQPATAAAPSIPITDAFNAQQISLMYKEYSDFRSSISPPHSAGFFVIKVRGDGSSVQVLPLSSWEGTTTRINGKPLNGDQILIGFADPSNLPSNPGWPLRNLLFLIKTHRWPTSFSATGTSSDKNITVLCLRESLSSPNEGLSQKVMGIDGTSFLLDITLPDDKVPNTTSEAASALLPPKATGWEKNASGKLGPRIVNLAPLMDPKRLANSAVDLNLKLMRWRILPQLDLEKIGALKCLLFGSGTLGSYTALALMAWGVRNISFIDNGEISFSNPVRQPLYEFKDCIGGGNNTTTKQFKAQVAADRLRKIFPSMNSKGHVMTVPMPGHPVNADAAGELQLKELERLVEEHDVIFLLTDSRESRWLPTLLGAVKGKIVINSALGFDNFLVMRHGMRVENPKSGGDDAGLGDALGCYFCNDVVAPTDSLKDRTLDQQCTVTRPGLSQMASGSAVELLMSVVSHSNGPWASSHSAQDPSRSLPDDASILGLVPHQIRGYLSQFQNMIITGQAYDKCTACSPKILNEFRSKGSEFLFRVFNDSKVLEQVTGLDELQKAVDDNDDWDVEDEGDDDF